MRELLTNVCRIQYGYAFDSSLFSDNQGLPLVRIRDVVRGFSETYTTETCCEDYIVHNGDMLIGMDGEFNIAKWKGGDALLNQRVCKLIPTERIDAGYLFYYMPSALKAIEDKTPFVTVKHLSAKELNKIEVPLPPMEKQRKIAKTLDSASAIITTRKQQLAELDNLVKARFIEMFGESRTNPMNWRTAPLESIANVGSSKRVFVEELQDNGIPFYRGTEVGALASGDRIMPELYITEEHYKTLKAATGVPVRGDLLMPSICPDGRIWLVDTDEPFYFKDGRVLWVHPTDSAIDSKYLLYVLKNTIMNDYGSIASGTTFAELKIFALKALSIMLPPLGWQKAFSTFIVQTDKSKAVVQHALEEAQTLFDSLMQQYFG